MSGTGTGRPDVRLKEKIPRDVLRKASLPVYSRRLEFVLGGVKKEKVVFANVDGLKTVGIRYQGVHFLDGKGRIIRTSLPVSLPGPSRILSPLYAEQTLPKIVPDGTGAGYG